MRRNSFYAVVHAVDVAQAVRNTGIAFRSGADGVFLINHSILPASLKDIYEKVRRAYPDFWIGLNFLGVNPRAVPAYFPEDADGLWMDDVGYQESEVGASLAMEFVDYLRTLCPGVTLFGGLDFKYQKPIRDLPEATRLMSGVVDVITTSGEATGLPPSPNKLRLMREAAPEARIAIASGMTPENVDDYLDATDCFLVATGVSKSFTELDPARVEVLAAKMNR